jgi:hypothetical protein
MYDCMQLLMDMCLDRGTEGTRLLLSRDADARVSALPAARYALRLAKAGWLARPKETIMSLCMYAACEVRGNYHVPVYVCGV